MQSILLILAILLIVFFAISPQKIAGIPLNIVSVPLAVLALCIVSGTISWQTVINGIQGYGNLRPWEIIIIFYSIAYVSISVDLSGILDYFAFRIVRRSNGNVLVLFIFFYLFSSLLTIFTSNDIVILTLTPIIFYLKKHADINIIPLLFAEFFGANTLSMLLYIGNPTNIIIGNALNLGFSEYSRIMLIPTIIAALANGILLFVMFRKSLQGRFVIHEDSKVELRSIQDAIISSSLLVIMLALLLSSQSIGLKIWWISLGFAVIYIIEDLGISIFHIAKNPRLYITELSADMKKIYALYGFASNRYDFFVIMRRLPWKILPFIIVIFILVQGLQEFALVETMANLLMQFSNNTATAIITNGGINFLLSNIINNQPAAILYAHILVSPTFTNGVSVASHNAAAYAVIVASNLGANLTLIGALAGLMWEKILSSKGVKISWFDFLKVGLCITPLVFLLSMLSLWLVMPK
jgi:arsenical pump membrane protein